MENVEEVHAIALANPSAPDAAILHDSEENDTFHALVTAGGHTAADMSGPGFYNYVLGFDSVIAAKRPKANDEARFFDSPGDDVLRARPNHATLDGPGFSFEADGFDKNLCVGRATEVPIKPFSTIHRATTFSRVNTTPIPTEPIHTSLRGAGFENHAYYFGASHCTGHARRSRIRPSCAIRPSDDRLVARADATFLTDKATFDALDDNELPTLVS